MRTLHYVIAIVVLMAVSVAIQVRRDQSEHAFEPATPMMWLQAGPAMERATLGYRTLVADLYWIRTVVYFGRQRLSKVEGKTYDLLYPYLDLVTSLDPRFLVAYRFGAIFLSERYPDGPHRPDLAITLLERGIARNPDRWELPHDLGFVHYFARQDYTAAAEWFERASAYTGAPFWLQSTAATMRTRGGDREASRMLWRGLYENAEAEAIKENALLRLAQLDALDVLDQLNPLVWRYKARTGQFPRNWAELVNAGVLRGIPADPTGLPFVLDAVNEDVRIARESKLLPLPDGLEYYGQ